MVDFQGFQLALNRQGAYKGGVLLTVERCFSQGRGLWVMLRLEASLKLAKEYYESHSYLPKHIRVCGCNRLLRKSAIYIHSCILSTSVTSYLNLLQKFSC